MKPIRFHREARLELESAVAWYEEKGHGLGLDFLTAVESATRLIGADPRKWRKQPDTELHRLSLKQFPYTVVYMETDREIWIAAVAHIKRDPGYWKHRRPEQP